MHLWQINKITYFDLFHDLVLWPPKSIGFCTNPGCISVPNLVKICQCIRKLCLIFHPDKQTNPQTIKQTRYGKSHDKSHVKWCHLISEEIFKIVNNSWNSREIMFNIVVSTVTADDIAPLDAGSSADSDAVYVIGTWKVKNGSLCTAVTSYTEGPTCVNVLSPWFIK